MDLWGVNHFLRQHASTEKGAANIQRQSGRRSISHDLVRSWRSAEGKQYGVLGLKSSRSAALPLIRNPQFADIPRKGLHLMKCLASSQGPKIRVNAILPGLLLTEWIQYSPQKIQQMKDTAVLKKEVGGSP